MIERGREIQAFLIAPGLIPAVLGLLGGLPFAWWSAIVTYGHALLLGVPIYLFLRRRKWLTPSSVLIGSFLIGVIPSAIFFATRPRSGYLMSNGRVILENGYLTNEGVIDLVALPLGLGVMGALTGIVWLLIAGINWPAIHVANKERTDRERTSAAPPRTGDDAGRYGNCGVAGRPTESLNSTMSRGDEWELFRSFDDLGSAEVMCSWLLREEVPAKVIARTLENGLESNFGVFVTRSLAHRARWVVAQLPPSDEELEYLATGKLPGAKDK